MYDLEQLILQAWRNLQPTFQKNPDELARRLARRRSLSFTAPPRPWCIAIRAADRRITPYTAIINPRSAVEPARTDLPAAHIKRTFSPMPHTVTLDADLVRQLTRFHRTSFPYSECHHLAQKLGRHYATLKNLTDHHAQSSPPSNHKQPTTNHNQQTTKTSSLVTHQSSLTFTSRSLKRLGGKPGRGTRTIFSESCLDPGSRNLAPAHPLWSTQIYLLADRVPPDLEQTITRVPVYLKEYKNNSRKLFRGWRWQCPACRRRVSTIYYPIHAVNALNLLEDADPHQGHPDAYAKPPPTFACAKCHKIRYQTFTTTEGWNFLISHLSAGLLYGHEVAFPERAQRVEGPSVQHSSLSVHHSPRKRPYAPRLNSRPPKRRHEVLERILKGWSFERIAQDLGLRRTRICHIAWELYKQHKVHSLEELRALYPSAHPPLDERKIIHPHDVEPLLRTDMTYFQIAEHLDCTIKCIHSHAYRIYARHKLKGRKAYIASLSPVGGEGWGEGPTRGAKNAASLKPPQSLSQFSNPEI